MAREGSSRERDQGSVSFSKQLGKGGGTTTHYTYVGDEKKGDHSEQEETQILLFFFPFFFFLSWLQMRWSPRSSEVPT